jgi:hypothetical protein
MRGCGQAGKPGATGDFTPNKDPRLFANIIREGEGDPLCALSTATARNLRVHGHEGAGSADWVLRCPYKPVMLATCRQLDGVAMQISDRDGAAFVLDRNVVDARATAADQPPRLAVAAGKSGDRE